MGLLDILGKVMDFASSQAESYNRKANQFLSEKSREIDSRLAKGEISRSQADAARKKVQEAREKVETSTSSFHRRSDEELAKEGVGSKSPDDYEYGTYESLKSNSAPSSPGVYVLYLNGSVMKCGRASYSGGLHWRFQQYYNLNYDDRARKGDYWSVSPSNRNDITVSWQCCPPAVCHELEYKLFQKYGKGSWAKRAPARCDSNVWKLYI